MISLHPCLSLPTALNILQRETSTAFSTMAKLSVLQEKQKRFPCFPANADWCAQRKIECQDKICKHELKIMGPIRDLLIFFQPLLWQLHCFS